MAKSASSNRANTSPCLTSAPSAARTSTTLPSVSATTVAVRAGTTIASALILWGTGKNRAATNTTKGATTQVRTRRRRPSFQARRILPDAEASGLKGMESKCVAASSALANWPAHQRRVSRATANFSGTSCQHPSKSTEGEEFFEGRKWHQATAE